MDYWWIASYVRNILCNFCIPGSSTNGNHPLGSIGWNMHGCCADGVCLFQARVSAFEKFEKELPEALELMVSALRAGHSLNAALGLVSRECQEPIRGEFRVCFEEQNYGLEIESGHG